MKRKGSTKIKRDPSIHVNYTEFQAICRELGISVQIAEQFFAMARKKSLNTRVVVVTKQSRRKQVNNLLLANLGDAYLIADVIYAVRVRLKQRGVRKINENNTRDWTNCKKLAEICNTFCNDFNLETREGFIKYVEIGISRMSDTRNLVQRLINMQENITEDYEAQLELSKLSRSQLELVIRIKDYFYSQIAEATGIYERDNKADKLIHFFKLKQLCDNNDWDYFKFIDAQFESLAWCNGIPNIRDLSDDKAIERYNKYLFRIRGKTKLNESEEEDGSLWAKIKDQDE